MKASPLISTFEFEVVFIDTQGNESKRDRRQAQFFTEALGNGIVLEIVQIPTGSCQIGSPDVEVGRSDDEEEQHSATLTSFFIGKYPITQAQWRAVALLPKVNRVLDPDPSFFNGLNRPVEQVSWHDAVEFCARLSRVTGRSYRLPTEVEWEYACRAGTLTPFHFGGTLTTDLANYSGEDHYRKNRSRQGILYKGAYGNGPTGISRTQTTEVGRFQVANAFGLYDMHGNVWEWCDRYPFESSLNAPVDSWEGSTSEEDRCQRPLRGGSWKSSPGACRSASRLLLTPNYRESFVGFRVVCSTTSDRSSSEAPSQGIPSQSILSNVQVGGNQTVGNITQIFLGR